MYYIAEQPTKMSCRLIALWALFLWHGSVVVAQDPQATVDGGIEMPAYQVEYDYKQRRLLQGDVMAAGNGRPPAWKARFDPRYEDSYLAPARIKNSCNENQKNCTGIVGKRYPYDEYILDPTTDGDKQPVIRIWYPKGLEAR